MVIKKVPFNVFPSYVSADLPWGLWAARVGRVDGVKSGIGFILRASVSPNASFE